MTAEEETTSTAVEVAPAQGDVQPATPTAEDFEVEWGSEVLLRFVRDLGLAYTAAKSLVKTSFVPQSYQGKPEEAAAAIVTGLGLGLDPLASLRSMDVISGTPAFRALTIRAIVQSHGHEIWVEESTSSRAIVKGRRKGRDKVETSVWDLDRARGLNLMGKSNWRTQPGVMLVARATSEVGRLVAADALLGMAYSIEELEDGVVPEPEQESPKPRGRRTAARKPRGGTAGAGEADSAADERTEVAADDSAVEAEPVGEFECPRCHQVESVEEGVLCASCEAEVAAEDGDGS